MSSIFCFSVVSWFLVIELLVSRPLKNIFNKTLASFVIKVEFETSIFLSLIYLINTALFSTNLLIFSVLIALFLETNSDLVSSLEGKTLFK